MREVDESLLPGILQEIAELIGLPEALKLADHYGGVRLYVPLTIPEGHVLAELVGMEAARKLSDRFGGMEHFDIPKARSVTVALRNRKIREAWPGLSQRQLALKYGLTERQVRVILSAEQPTETQLDLFESALEESHGQP